MGNKLGSKRTSTLVRDLYNNALHEVAQHRIAAVMQQVARDALDDELDPKVRQKAQQMLIQAAQKATDQDIELDKQSGNSEPLKVDIRRDGVLIQARGQSISIDTTRESEIVEGGVGSSKGGDRGREVPYISYPSSKITETSEQYPSSQFPETLHKQPLISERKLTSLNPDDYEPHIADQLFDKHGRVRYAYNSKIPLYEFVGPLRMWGGNINYGLPKAGEDEYLNHDIGYKECYCIERPVEMGFDYEVIK